jgi:hypothetical protein
MSASRFNPMERSNAPKKLPIMSKGIIAGKNIGKAGVSQLLKAEGSGQTHLNHGRDKCARG